MSELNFEWTWSGTNKAVNQSELSRVSAMTVPELEELMEYGALIPLASRDDPPERLFMAECVTSLRTAGKLRRDFDLDLFAVAFLLDYLNRIEILEDQVRTLQAHVSGRTGAALAAART